MAVAESDNEEHLLYVILDNHVKNNNLAFLQNESCVKNLLLTEHVETLLKS